MNSTSIEWTDFSANLLKYRNAKTGKIVWHCEKVSPGCAHCYAESMATRFGGGPFNAKVTPGVRPFFDEEEARKILRSKKIAGKRIFVDDMTDWMGDWVSDDIIAQHLALFALRPDVTFQLLTKRADRLRRFVGAPNAQECVDHVAFHLSHESMHSGMYDAVPDVWPLPNVWLGVSCEDQKRADERIPLLLQTPAAVRFLSVEPMLGPVDLQGRLVEWHRDGSTFFSPVPHSTPKRLFDWLICGGESGGNSRPFNLAWARSLRDQCAAAGVPFFFKQAGSNPQIEDLLTPISTVDIACIPPGDDPAEKIDSSGNGVIRTRQLLRLRDRKGGDLSEIPEDLRIREMPQKEIAK